MPRIEFSASISVDALQERRTSFASWLILWCGTLLMPRVKEVSEHQPLHRQYRAPFRVSPTHHSFASLLILDCSLPTASSTSTFRNIIPGMDRRYYGINFFQMSLSLSPRWLIGAGTICFFFVFCLVLVANFPIYLET